MLFGVSIRDIIIAILGIWLIASLAWGFRLRRRQASAFTAQEYKAINHESVEVPSGAVFLRRRVRMGEILETLNIPMEEFLERHIQEHEEATAALTEPQRLERMQEWQDFCNLILVKSSVTPKLALPKPGEALPADYLAIDELTDPDYGRILESDLKRIGFLGQPVKKK